MSGWSKSFLFGTVGQFTSPTSQLEPHETAPLSGALVTLVGADSETATVSDDEGAFRFDDVDPGSYTLSAELDPYVPDPPLKTVDVAQGACARVFLVLSAPARLAGTLRLEDGRLAGKKRIELLRRRGSGKWYSTSQFFTYTDASGVFEFDGIPTGDYLLGYRIWASRPVWDSPYHPHHFPGVRDREDAEILLLDPYDVIEGLDFRLSDPDARRNIKVIVRWPDGSIPGDNRIEIRDGKRHLKSFSGAQKTTGGASPEPGSLEIVGFEERGYDLNACYWIDTFLGHQPMHSQKRIAVSEIVRVEPGQGPVLVDLVLTRRLLAGER